jgi:hypothetical protein
MAAISNHPWQQPEFIEENSKRTSEQMIELVHVKWDQQYANFEEHMGMRKTGTKFI